MTDRRLACIWALAAFPVFAQLPPSPMGGNYRTPLLVAGPPAPKFEMHVDSPGAAPDVTAGYANVPQNSNQPYSSGHRYFYDASAHTYFGYDVVIEPGPQANTFRATFYELSVGPLDFLSSPRTPVDPTQWKKIPLPAVPVPTVIQSGDAVSIEVFVNPDTQQKLTDSVSVQLTIRDQRAPTVFRRNQTQATARAATAAAEVPRPPTAATTGIARDFAVEDAVLHLRGLRVTLSGGSPQYSQADRAVSGPLVWFYAPAHGQYILSLAPRPELGFVQAGEVRGKAVTFIIGEDSVIVEAQDAIAPDDAAYTLYVLRDPSWIPTAPNPAEFLLVGSVSARELAALKAK
jgi:hypothetical protein